MKKRHFLRKQRGIRFFIKRNSIHLSNNSFDYDFLSDDRDCIHEIWNIPLLYPFIEKYEIFKSLFLSMKYAVDKVILDSWSCARRRHWLIRLQLRIQQLFFLLLGRPHHNCCEKEGLGSRVEGCNYFIKSNTFEEITATPLNPISNFERHRNCKGPVLLSARKRHGQ